MTPPPAKALTLAWRARPVFLTSTFRDLHAERDWLRHKVFPELEERLRQRLGHLEVIDLRWGVQTATVGETEAKEILVLKVCLGEIERSRPFLIGLIGDRYGWVPPVERTEAAAREAGYTADVRGRSITALEIEYGVLESADQRRRSHFYFRDPLPYAEMDPATAADYSEVHTGDPQAPQRQAALDALKTRIARQLPDRTHRYTAQWDQERGIVTGLEAFGRQVLEDLWRDLEMEFPPLAGRAVASWQDEEQAELEAFIEQRNRDFVGRDELLRELKEFALGSPLTLSLSPAGGEGARRAGEGVTALLSLTGPPGSGKSAVLCRLHRLLEREDALLLTHAAGISLHAGSVDRLLLRWIGQLAVALDRPAPVDDTAKPDELEQAFAQLLGQAAARRRVVLLLDALDQFEPTVRARFLTWLPRLWPANARVIATAIPCDASRALEQWPNALARALAPLEQPESELMAEKVCARYHRRIAPDVVQVLVSKQTPAGQAAAGSPLWLELALEELNLLDQDDFQRAEKTYAGTPEDKIRQLLLDTARALPPEVQALYDWMFDRAGELWGKPWADAFLCLTALSRAGWRETDLEELLPKTAELLSAPTAGSLTSVLRSPSSDFPWDPLRFAALRRAFRAHLVRRGALGQWDFHHAQTRRAVGALRLSDAATVQRLHRLCADHLLTLPDTDPLRDRETMHHLIGADDRPRAARFFALLSAPFETRTEAARTLAEWVLASPEVDPNSGLAWTLSLPDQAGLEPDTQWRLCNRCQFDLHDALENEARLGVRLRLLEATRTALQRLAGADPTNAGWQRDLSVSQERIGEVLLAQGDLAGALQAYRESMAVRARLAGADPTNAGWQRDLWVSYWRMAAMAEQAGTGDAHEWWRKAYETISAMKQRGILLPTDEQYLVQLRQKLEGPQP